MPPFWLGMLCCLAIGIVVAVILVVGAAIGMCIKVRIDEIYEEEEDYLNHNYDPEHNKL